MKKLTVEIDLTDLWDDEEAVSEILTREVRNSAIRTLSKEIHGKSLKAVSDETSEFIASSDCVEKMKARIMKKIESGPVLIKQGYSNHTPLDEYIGERMKEALGNDEWTKYVNKKVTAAFAVLEKRYNDEFAIGILTKLKENNMLTDEAKNLLQSNSKPSSD